MTKLKSSQMKGQINDGEVVIKKNAEEFEGKPLSDVALSGDYDDLINKPENVITSDDTDEPDGFLTIKNMGAISQTDYNTAHTNNELVDDTLYFVLETGERVRPQTGPIPPQQSIDPNQDYDMVQTLTFENPNGDCNIRLYRGSNSASSGTVYYRAGTSGAWTAKSVSGTSDTFPVSSTTMQVAHDWNKDGNNYMTCSFYGQSTNLKEIYISLKAVLSGVMGDYFMSYYAHGCTSLTSLSVPDTSGLTSVGDDFMAYYAFSCSSLTSLSVPDISGLTTVGDGLMNSYASGCSSLTSLSVPDTSGLTTVGDRFMSSYAFSCTSLTSLSVPDTSGLTSVGDKFMYAYAYGCSSLTSLILPKAGWFETNNVGWSVPSERLGVLKGKVIDAGDLTDRQGLTTNGKTLHTNYIQDPNDVSVL